MALGKKERTILEILSGGQEMSGRDIYKKSQGDILYDPFYTTLCELEDNELVESKMVGGEGAMVHRALWTITERGRQLLT